MMLRLGLVPRREGLDVGVEWPTLAVILLCSAGWAVLTAWGTAAPWLTAPILALVLTLHSSLQHEAIHGHPTGNRHLNAALVFPAVGLFVPYGRFRDTHLAHHRDERLTDPYDDPETQYLDPATWRRLPWPLRRLLQINNSLAGRILVGPAIGLTIFYMGEARLLARGDRGVAQAWARHLVALCPVIGWLWWTGFPTLPYLVAVYMAFALLRIRTYLEHRAHSDAAGRTVIVEDRGLLAFLFLNNNYHAVHHARPRLPWYALPSAYRAARDQVLAQNDGYRFASYADVARRYLFRAKEPVPHPLWPER